MANIPQEPTAALGNLLRMQRNDLPSGGECPSCGRHNPRTATVCSACGHSLIPPRPQRSLLRRLFRR